MPPRTSLYSVKTTSCVTQIVLKYKQPGVMCILNWDIMTNESHYCESRWYIGLDGNTLVSPFYTRSLHVVINMWRLTGTFPAICGYGGKPKSRSDQYRWYETTLNCDVVSKQVDQCSRWFHAKFLTLIFNMHSIFTI